MRDLALAYAGRYATTAAKLKHYLQRKIRERGWANDDEPQVDGLIARFVELGYIDDEAFAEMRQRELLRRGYGARRVEQALHHAGVDSDRIDLPPPSESETRSAALAFARRRRLGPFGAEPPDPRTREKQLAALVRAGHDFEAARAMVDARSEEEAEEWAFGDGE
ncbi:regulatory protein RecX [Alteriqipengyuania lutimaris]|uniref:Regulatory protein RecX n=1 Tax=Alteriqipengyuania lutimaris TaxID=1538146 RepID=A0A395LK57_9SPHN|nr:RecX family transcriptional regulator [Alteriqipengyuania lutimaris]MBB3033952.1 regulatory protein [Alteriqipengyuania lutimaris]RDS77095.1 RecX family transcriptional regulator [Alteriqipengyuania lutimaris]